MRLLKNLYMIDSESHHEENFTKLVELYCKQRGGKTSIDRSGNLYVTKGKATTYPCVVAHLDEVHRPRGKNFHLEVTPGGVIRGWNAANKPHGIGADDKNGIWIALKCLEKFEAIKCAFFPCEEVGCLGSSAADIDFFKDCRFVVECDRKNSGDFITSIGATDLCSKKFIKDVAPEDWGYQVENGLMTDVSALKHNGLAVSCCNMSCGYYRPHTADEYTVFCELEKCLRFVEHIIRDCTSVYKHECSYGYGYGRGGYGYGSGYGYYGYSRGGFFEDDDWYRPKSKKTTTSTNLVEVKTAEPKPAKQEKVEQKPVEQKAKPDASFYSDAFEFAYQLVEDGCDELDVVDALMNAYNITKMQAEEIFDDAYEHFMEQFDDDESYFKAMESEISKYIKNKLKKSKNTPLSAMKDSIFKEVHEMYGVDGDDFKRLLDEASAEYLKEEEIKGEIIDWSDSVVQDDENVFKSYICKKYDISHAKFEALLEETLHLVS